MLELSCYNDIIIIYKNNNNLYKNNNNPFKCRVLVVQVRVCILSNVFCLYIVNMKKTKF